MKKQTKTTRRRRKQDDLQRRRTNHRRRRLNSRQRQPRQPAAARCFNPPTNTLRAMCGRAHHRRCAEKRGSEESICHLTQARDAKNALHGTTFSPNLSLCLSNTHIKVSPDVNICLPLTTLCAVPPDPSSRSKEPSCNIKYQRTQRMCNLSTYILPSIQCLRRTTTLQTDRHHCALTGGESK